MPCSSFSIVLLLLKAVERRQRYNQWVPYVPFLADYRSSGNGGKQRNNKTDMCAQHNTEDLHDIITETKGGGEEDKAVIAMTISPDDEHMACALLVVFLFRSPSVENGRICE